MNKDLKKKIDKLENELINEIAQELIIKIYEDNKDTLSKYINDFEKELPSSKIKINEDEPPEFVISKEKFLPVYFEFDTKDDREIYNIKFLFPEDLHSFIFNNIDSSYDIDEEEFIVEHGYFEEWNDKIIEFINFIKKNGIDINELGLSIFNHSIDKLYKMYKRDFKEANGLDENEELPPEEVEVIWNILREDIDNSIETFKDAFADLYKIWNFTYSNENYLDDLSQEFDIDDEDNFRNDLKGIEFKEIVYEDERYSPELIVLNIYPETIKNMFDKYGKEYEIYIYDIFTDDSIIKNIEMYLDDVEFLNEIYTNIKENRKFTDFFDAYIMPHVINKDNLHLLNEYGKNIILNTNSYNKRLFLYNITKILCK